LAKEIKTAREKIGAGAARPRHIDLPERDPERNREALAAHLRPRNEARQLSDPLRKGGIEACGTSEAVPHGVARRACLGPWAVFGPRLRRPFLRLASRLASLIMAPPEAEFVPVLFLAESRGKCKQDLRALRLR
jgi:hypothetical protein